MAHFYGTLRSFDGRKEHTKAAGKNGLEATAAGWGVGAKISMSHDDSQNPNNIQEDIVEVWITLGSNSHSDQRQLIFRGTRKDVERRIELGQ